MDNLTRPEGSEPEDFHLTRRAAVSMFFAGYALAAVAADASPIVTPADGLQIDEVLVPNGAPKPLPAYVARPKGRGRHAAIVVVNEIFGIHDYIKDICRRLAKLGYVAIAPDFFYRSGVNLPALTDIAQIRPVVPGDPGPGRRRRALDHGLAEGPGLREGREDRDHRLLLGRRRRLALGDGRSRHPRRSRLVRPAEAADRARAAELKAPVLGLYGALDQGIPQTDVEAMRAALKAAGKTGSDIVVYPDAQHGFHADYRASYNEKDAKDGWARLLAHFRKNGMV
jgi:carboxymethylenebutenolidase